MGARKASVVSMPMAIFLSLLAIAFADVIGDDFCYYTILGLEPDPEIPHPESVVIKAYRKLSREYHPDRAGNNPQRQATYLKIQRAYEVLGDRRLRKVYDLAGHEGVKKYEEEKNRPEGMRQQGMFPFGFFHQESDRGETKQIEVGVNLEKIYNGETITINVQKNKLCSRCKGSGAFSKEHFKSCGACGGKGHTMKQMRMGPFVQHVQQTLRCVPRQGETAHEILPYLPRAQGPP